MHFDFLLKLRNKFILELVVYFHRFACVAVLLSYYIITINVSACSMCKSKFLLVCIMAPLGIYLN